MSQIIVPGDGRSNASVDRVVPSFYIGSPSGTALFGSGLPEASA